ncbi:MULTISPECIES: ABC transporter ATP-binding protein [Roseobacteraceae]|uniref:Branched-chain amino acid ABC transporter ATP-binding protein n=1 Tax=Celeribacter baekdonensis B30 TaxID=1208323 RepID=K2J384_9RHOB|nr:MULTISPECIES: ABC transporter ATP-binding protein [Roseobacteraceae]EKE69337.1 branched-chain amino acid ABC transporter ATP-binding protein [Celeribacter baekdonensis B30]KAB6717258.1 ABC transporter ATP-binding protein [Roseobacter sp. TSBP12]|tara:strand:- start:26833 stop:27576 length:744 start_codon:yes stop_codon:yes gene_type:complete
MAEVTLLETRGLARHFDGLKAVDGVDFTLNVGEIRAIIGPNGAGKSTFVSLLSGRIPPSAGQVFFDGKDVTNLPAFKRVRLGIAYTFQITNIYPSLTVLENIEIAVQNRLKPSLFGGASEAQIQSEAALAAQAVGLGDRIGDTAGNLAYGHQRLLEVAMGLGLEPKLLILDEPTQGLSDAEIKNFIEVVKRVNETATVLIIEHNMDVVLALADRITVLERGRLLAEGTPDEIVENVAVQAAYLGEPA